MRFAELTLMPQSTRRVLVIANTDSKRLVTKVSGKSIQKACGLFPDDICFEDRSFMGDGHCYTYAELKAKGIKSILVRCNRDFDLVTVKVA